MEAEAVEAVKVETVEAEASVIRQALVNEKEADHLPQT